jgi:acyl carrier protein
MTAGTGTGVGWRGPGAGRDGVAAAVRECLGAAFGPAALAAAETDKLGEEGLGADSLDLTEVAMHIEDTFGIEYIGTKKFGEIGTVGGLIDFVHGSLPGAAK